MANKQNLETFNPEAETIEINNQAKFAILKFLKELGVNRIIYIDDRCSIQENKEEFIAKLKSLYEKKPKQLDFVNWTVPKPKFELDIAEIWKNSDDELKRQHFYKILDVEGNVDDLDNSKAPLTLKNYLEDKIQLLSPSDWERHKEDILKELNSDKKILFLFDIEFNSAPLESKRDGIDLTEELLSKTELKDFVYCGVFSHLFSPEEELAKRNELQNEKGFDKKRFYTISKKRFTNGSFLPGLAEGIRNTLIINEIEQLKKESETVLQKSFKSSFDEIQGLDPESFSHIIEYSSYQEGTWEMLNLIRIQNIVSQQNALKNLLPPIKRSKINGYLKNIRKIKDIETGSTSPFDKTQVQKLREKELYIQPDILNKLHFPISNGDIFKIKGKEYILIGQPCNLSLRKTGRRDIMSGKVYDSGFLLKIDSIKKDKFDQFRPGQLATIGVLQNAELSSNKIRIVRFQLYKTVGLSPLDLTVYNIDGTASINLNLSEHDSTTIQESWKLRYKDIYKEFSYYRDNIRSFKKLKSASKNSLKNLVYYGELFKDYDINNDNVLNLSGNQITLDIKRISHYKEPFSSDLLQQFMQYLSRNAFERDFLND